jgi:hypothetical protein
VNFESLRVYREKYLDCCVPSNYKEDPSLGRWVNNRERFIKEANYHCLEREN